MLRKLAGILVLITVCLSMFTACDTASLSNNDVYIRFVAVSDKALDIADSGRIEKYEYTAEPQFETTSPRINGTRTDWTEVEGNEESSALIGPFTQGLWKFQLRAVTQNGVVTWEGESEWYIGASTDSIIPITMSRVPGTGFIDIRLNIPEYTSEITEPTVMLDGITVAPEWTESGRDSGIIEFHTTISDISVGWHEVIVRAGAGGTMVGEAVAVEITNGNYAFITGTFNIGEYTPSYLKLDAPEAARSEIHNSDGEVITSDEINRSETPTYTYVMTNGRDSAEVTWYVNGEKQGTSNTFTFKPAATGIFELSALSRYYAESTMGSTWIEESTSSSITVYVEPQMSTITWNTGDVVTRQFAAYDTVLTIGAPTREGYEFKEWSVTGSTTDTYKQGDTLEVEGAAYTFTAVWDERPKLKLTADTDTGILSMASGSADTVEEDEELDVIIDKSGDYRWFVDGKEVFWILDKGNGLFTIPTRTDAGLRKGKYVVTIEGEVTVEGEVKKVTGTFNLTWE